MRRPLRRYSVFLVLFALLTSLPFVLFAADTGTRVFAPVQLGYQADAPRVPAYAPGRILVKFTEEAMENSRIPGDLRFGEAIQDGATGMLSVDQAIGEVDRPVLQRAYIELANKTLARDLGVDRWFSMTYEGPVAAWDMAQRLARLPEVESATVDWVAFPAAVPSDPLHSIHWGHNNTAQMLSFNWSAGSHEAGSPVGTVGFDANAQAAWDGAQGYGSASVVIAIIDSGVEAGHPDLRQVAGYDYGDNDSNPDDNSSSPGHGTACAGVAAAMTNSLGTAGIAAGCSIMPLKVANSAGSMYFSSIQNALYHAADNGADIISMSLGAAISSDPATDSALQYAFNAGCTILAATGNENASTISYPAINQYVIAVGAASPCGDRKRSSSSSSEVNPGVSTDPNGYTCDGERWWGSNYGINSAGAAAAVDIIAPTILPTTDLLGSAGYDASDYSKWFNGTSCATPYAAGVAALVLSANPTWTPTQIRDQLRNTAQDVTSVESGSGWDRYAGYGMVDAAAAVGGGGGPVDAVTVTYPNGGESLAGGSAVSITWTSSGTFSTVNIDYSLNGGSSWTAIVSGTADDGSHTWSVPSSATTQGRVRVSGGTASDQSNANFTITVTPTGSYASLPYSTGFESGSFDAYWTSASTGDGRVRFLTSNTPHSGSYHLTMDDASSGGYTTNEARLHLDLSGESQVDLAFWWKEFGDETHSTDGVYFSSNGGASFVKVQNLNGQSYTNNTWQSFNLDLDALASANGLALTSTFVIKFQQYDNYPIATDGFAFDDISVTGSAPPVDAVTVTAPNGGENLTSGTSTNITWTSVGSFTTVNLDYSTNGGSSWTAIVSGTPNDGTHSWTVPATATTQGRVRVSGGTATDMSNANFTITVPPADAVTVTAPNGGETLTAGNSTNITWTSVGSFTTVNLDYSTNGGSSWTSIVSGTANDGTHAWTVPSTATTSGRVRVSGGTATDQSNANFTIEVPPSSGYASLPYSTGFETGALDQYWSTTSTSNGRVRLLTSNTPHSGSYHLTMDAITNGTYATNDADLHLNLAGQTQVDLAFWWKEFGDETHSADGVYFSSNGGASFVKVQNLNGQSYSNNTWQSFTLDLDALAAANGLSLTGTFVVRFQQYDNYAMTTDGFAFDDISVTVGSGGGGGAITAESEPNDTSGTADGPMGTGVAVSGAISSNGEVDWYYFDISSAGSINISLNIGSSADLDWFLYNSSLTEVARGYTTSNPEVGNYTASAGRYYLMVDGYLSATSSYTVTVNGGLANIIQPAMKGLVPTTTALLQNSPNPFRSGTAIRFNLVESGRVTVQVFDVNGRLVSTLASREYEPGSYTLDWQGVDDSGQRVNAGVYFYRLITPEFTDTRKMLLIR